MTLLADVVGHWLGLCRKAPALRTAPGALVVPEDHVPVVMPKDGGSPGSSGRVRRGIRIATGSLMALFRDRHLLWFTFLAGLVMLFLILAEGWRITHLESVYPFRIAIPFESPLIANMFIVIDMQFFLLETVCLSFFSLVLAGLVLHRTNTGRTPPATIRESFSRINGNTGSLLALSITLALLGTLLDVILSQTLFFGKIVSGISMTVFFLPYAYYFPNELFSVLFFATQIMFINSILLLAALSIVPGIVLERNGLVPALAGAAGRARKTWRELFGCLIVLGILVLGVAVVALVIGQSPLLLNHDYDFFLQVSRGQVLMTAACYGFIAACWGLLAVGYTAAGIAMADLYACATNGNGTRPD